MMNSQDTVTALSAEVNRRREHDRNTGQDRRWHGLDAVPNAVGHAIRKTGGFVTPEVIAIDRSTRITEKSGFQMVTRGIIRYRLFGSDLGEPISHVVLAEAFDKGDKGTEKMMKIAFRTFLIEVLHLPTDRAVRNSDPSVST
jgi:hypothetical protein